MNNVRVVKFDEHNFGIQRYTQCADMIYPKGTKGVGIPNPKAGEWEWRDETFYGHRLDDALKFAVLKGMDDGEAKESLRLFHEAMKAIPVIDSKEKVA